MNHIIHHIIAYSPTDTHMQARSHKQGSIGATPGKTTHGVIAKLLQTRLIQSPRRAEELYLLLTIITVELTYLEDFLHSWSMQKLDGEITSISGVVAILYSSIWITMALMSWEGRFFSSCRQLLRSFSGHRQLYRFEWRQDNRSKALINLDRKSVV